MRKMTRKRIVPVLMAAAACWAQAPADSQKLGSVSGTVASLAGQPLKNATVRLQYMPQGKQSADAMAYSVSSDAQGKFLFEAIAPGHYLLLSEHTGYLGLTYSANSRSPGSQLDLTSGQQLTSLSLKMTPQALIEGRITTVDDEPFPSVRVAVSRVSYAGGRRSLQPAGTASSDAEGGFAIGNLAAGSYYLSATDLSVAGRQELRGRSGTKEDYVTTYYPGVVDASAAVLVQVAAGAVARGIDIRMRRAMVYRVVGKVVDLSSPDSPPDLNLTMAPKEQPNAYSGFNFTARSRNGAFEFSGVLPGVYLLLGNPTGPRGSASSRQLVTVGNGDLDGVVVQLGKGVEVLGRVTMELAAAPPPNPASATNLRAFASLTGVTGGYSAGVEDDGTFVFHNVTPDFFHLYINGLPPGTYLKSVRFGGQDVTKTAIDLTSVQTAQLDVLLSPNAAEVKGVVHDTSPDGNGQPVTGVQVTLWTPGIPAEDTAGFSKDLLTDENGQFDFTFLPPGEYRIAAWEKIDPGLSSVPEFRGKFDTQAVTVKVNELDHQTVDAPLITRDRIETEASKLR